MPAMDKHEATQRWATDKLHELVARLLTLIARGVRL